MILADTVSEAAERFGDQLVYDGWDGRLTYAELAAAARTRADELRAMDVQRHDVVAVALPSGIDYLVTYAASARLGATTAGVNTKLAPGEQDQLLRPVRHRVLVDASGTRRVGDHDPVDSDDDPLATVVFTSGTTGIPKGAMFGDEQLAAIMAIDLGVESVEDAPWGGGGPLLVSTGMSHIGFMTKLPTYLRTGATLVGLERWRAEDVLRAVAHHRMTTIGGVAPQIALLLRSPLVDQLDLTCVTAFIVGGALSSPALVREVRERFGAAYSIRYSSTESGGVGLGTAFDAPDEEAFHTVGRPRPGVEVRIDRPGDDGIGELCIRSGAQMAGYLGDPDATAAAIDPVGWLHTGDLARLDDAGCYRLSGRIKEMYIRGGYNVFPAEVEAVLADHPAIAEVAVAPMPDEVMGELGVAVVTLRPGAPTPTLGELRSFAAERLARWKLPEDLLVVADIPRTAGDKIDRAAIRALVGG